MNLIFVLFAIINVLVRHCINGQDYIIKKTIIENQNGGSELINLKTYIQRHNIPIVTQNATFSLVTQNRDSNAYFLLDSHSGSLKLRSGLDREEICKQSSSLTAAICKLILLIHCNNNKILEFQLTIKDENDETPQFPVTNKLITIQENSELGLELSLPTAKDRDSIKNGIKRYYMADMPSVNNRHMASKYFNVIQKTVNQIPIPYLKVIRLIDREQVESFQFILIAEDSGKSTGSTSVSIKVTDLNDNSPQWSSTIIQRKVKECEPQGSILELQAYDLDDSTSSTNGQIKYKISDHTTDLELINKLFYIAGNKLYLSSHSLQNFKVSSRLSFYITAIDGGGRENDTNVVIEIEDCNDHAPQIQMDKNTVNIRENDKRQFEILSFTVKDDDKGINSEFECSMNDTGYFNMKRIHKFKQANGGILTMYKIEKLDGKSFDREQINYYSIIIRCTDRGSPSMTGQRRLGVNILDVNDNSPKFPTATIQFSITENNAIGALVGYVRAVDPDLQDNGRIIYSLEGSVENRFQFSISSQTGALDTKKRFDRETEDSYQLVVVATDSGTPARSDSCTVQITILDVNDCTPRFMQQYFYKVTESNGQTTIHKELGRLNATDDDLGENKSVNYKLKPISINAVLSNRNQNQRPMSQPWQLLRLSPLGQLSIYGIVDREQFTSLQVDVVAYDNGRPQLSAVTTVVIEILDVNDNSPEFILNIGNHGYVGRPGSRSTTAYANVSYDSPVGTVVGTYAAVDKDKGENGMITYSIINGLGSQNGEKPDLSNADFPFQLQQDGRLILVNDLKNNKQSRDGSIVSNNWRRKERILIKATDGGKPQRSEILTLHLTYIKPQQAKKHLSKTKETDSYDKMWNNHNGNQGSGDIYDQEYNKDNEMGTDNLILLYVLAGVLFVVFLIVLLVLLYTYFSGRLGRTTTTRNLNNHYEKDLNNFTENFSANYECEMLNPSQHHSQDAIAKFTMESIQNQRGDKSNYTHLMAMHDPSKYTPIHFSPNYSFGPLTSAASPPLIETPNNNNSNINGNYQTPIFPQSRYMLEKSNHGITAPNTNFATSTTRSSSIENILINTPGTINKFPRSSNQNTLHSAHSYGAQLNMFGKEGLEDPPNIVSGNDDHGSRTHARDSIKNKTKTLPMTGSSNQGTYQVIPSVNNANNMYTTAATVASCSSSGHGNIMSSNKNRYITSSFV